MSDNIALKNDDETTVATIRTDDIGGIHYATTKISLGADGTHDGFVASGNPLPVSGTVTVTGVATTANQTNGDQKAQIVDGSGNVIGSTANALDVNIASGTAVTEYTEDAAAAANPAGPMNMAVRADTLAAVTTTDGDNIALRATNKGELNVKHADTLAISAASLPLPSGASTAAKQPALGTAGTASTDVLSIQGIAAMTPLLVNGSAVTQPVSDAGGTLTVDDGGTSLTVDGTVALSAGSAIIGSVSINQTTPGTTNLVALAANQSVNQTQVNGVAVSVGAGATDTGTQRVTLTTDGTGVLAGVTTVATVTNITNQGQLVDNAAFTDATTRVTMAGFIYDEVAGTTLTENDAAAARIDAKRAQICVIEDGTVRGRVMTVSASGGLGTDVLSLAGTAVAVSNGAVSSGTQRVTIANDSTGILAGVTTVATVTAVTTVSTVTTVGTLTSITNWGNVVDNAAFSDGSTRLSIGGFIYDEVAGTGLTENDAAAARVDVKRAQVHVLEDAVERGRRQVVTAAGAASVDLAQLAGATLSSGNGTAGTGTIRVSVASDSTGVLNVVDNAAFVDGTTRVSMGGFIYDEVAGTALSENDAAAARIDAKRAQVFTLEDHTTRGQRQTVTGNGGAYVELITSGGDLLDFDNGTSDAGTVRVTVCSDSTGIIGLFPRTSGGTTAYSLISANTTNATVVKASAGQLFGLDVTNVNAAVMYLKLYNKATTPDENDTPVARIRIPGATTGTIFSREWPYGLAFSAGIAFRMVTALADNSTSAVAANEVVLNMDYK